MNLSDLIPLNDQFLWMNLSQPERWYIPGTEIGIPILTIIVVITTYAQQKLMTPPSMGGNDQSAQMTKTMNMYMPLLMGWISFTLAAGLAIYFVVSNLIGIFQYAMMGQIDWRNWRNLIPFMGSKPEPQAKKTSFQSEEVIDEGYLCNRKKPLWKSLHLPSMKPLSRDWISLDCPRDAVDVEILDSGSKGLLGLGHRQAQGAPVYPGG